ncbi:flavin reductase family protein [Staphylococcus argensis]|uniref:flavin reductase family protein n=1 Tax=Staphylococcus argensis TaxID=1607738 RepID=UPI0011A3FE03|nr:flavin reductase family protein [Staphylococcus argensis]MCY6992002.1 flavin reductase family protein [Staphylococcus argensis]
MKQFLAVELSKTQNYKLLTGGIIPRPIAFVTTHDKRGTLNAAPFSFFNAVCAEPPMVMISVGRKDGERKDTTLNILDNEEFVVHITDEDIIEAVNTTAASHDRSVNELNFTDLEVVPSESVKVPGVKQAKIRFECRLHQLIPLGDEIEGSDIIIGEVVHYHIDDDIYYDDTKINADQLNAIARLSGSNYSKLGEQFTIERPES